MKKTLAFFLACLFMLQLLQPVPVVWAENLQTTEAAVLTEDSEPTEPTEPEPTEPEPRADELHRPYLSGSTDGGFHPTQKLSRAELAVILNGLGSYAPGTPCFSDVRSSAWYANAIYALSAAGIVGGYPDGTFRPTAPVTRAELVTMLAKLSGETASQDTTFPDVSATSWARPAISLAQEKGWVSGYSDGTFRPQNSVTRAEAVVMLNCYLGRSPDRAAIDRGEGLRFFPDVSAKSWYYSHVMEATTGHTAHWDTPDAGERWLNPYSGESTLKDGFYSFDTRIYAVRNGSFVRTAGEGSLNGVTYSCLGQSGVCTVRTEVLTLYNGKLTLLSGGKPLAAVNAYEDGLYLKAGQLYAAQNGEILREAKTGSYNGIPFTCTGSSGICTTPDWTRLNLPQSNLSVFTGRLTDEASQTGTATVTTAQALKAAVKVYEAYFRVEYPLTSGTDSQYIQRALAYNILDKAKSDYTDPVHRGELAQYLWRALRGRELEPVNEVECIPDVPASHALYPVVFALYRTGVMGGVDEARNAQLNGTVQKTELAGLLSRLEVRANRLRFSLRAKTIETIEYGRSGSGRYPLTACRLGTGSNVMVLTFALHGWEDNWDRDGQELVYLADQVRNWLEEHYDLLQKGNWTVYVLRCLNPDGLYLGTTCNGPGRCTTTRLDANGTLHTDRGIDMNRCFPYRFQIFTDSRNYNGTGPLQCKEAKALAEFVKSVKGSGHNICVDTHGWLGQVITSSGQDSLSSAFMKQFPNSYYTYMAKGYGYFTAWTGFSLGYDSCLLEMPEGIYSHESFLSKGCVWRYENALKELLETYDGPNVVRGLLEQELWTVEESDN